MDSALIWTRSEMNEQDCGKETEWIGEREEIPSISRMLRTEWSDDEVGAKCLDGDPMRLESSVSIP